MQERGPDKVSPLGIPILRQRGKRRRSMKYGLRGQSFGTVSASSAGAHAIGIAARLIAYGDADRAVAGGTESTLTPLTIAGFSKMEALSKKGIPGRSTAPRRLRALRGRGGADARGGIAARERGARVLGRLRGDASTSDAST